MVKAKATRQQALWHERLGDALKSVVEALGGPKAVAAQLWPPKPPDDAARYLSHCLDHERPEKLALEEVVWILQAGARAGCHVGMYFLADRCSYDRPKPVTKEERRTEIQQQFIDAVSTLDALRKDLARLDE